MKTIVLISLVFLPGCEVVNTSNMKLTLLCNRSIVDRNGFNITDENLRHVRCDKKTPLRFSFTF